MVNASFTEIMKPVSKGRRFNTHPLPGEKE